MGFSFAMSLVKLFSKIIIGWVAVSLCLAATIIVGALVYAAIEPLQNDPIVNSDHLYGSTGSEHKLLSLRIDGTIDGQAPADSADRAQDTVYGYDVKDQLLAAAKDDQVAGVILEINSPGGAIYGAQAIADGVKTYRDKTHKPVYAHVSGMAASGAYWAAASTDRIIADLGSSIGSIGVIEGPFYYYDKVLSADAEGTGTVVTQNGIQAVTITAGKGKDLGDPYRKMTPEDIAGLQEAVNADYAAFVDYVSSRRHISPDTIRNQLGAAVFGTQGAASHQLIDDTAGREAAYAQLAAAAHLKDDDYEVVRPGEPVVSATSDTSLGDQVSSLLHLRGAPNAATTSRATSRPAARNAASRPSTLCGSQNVKAYYGDLGALCNK
jgi:protease-4